MNDQSIPLPGAIGHYQILQLLGRGGMGLVYLARDTRLDRLVAIKCLRSDLLEPHYRERFTREALLLAKLNHPHIVQIYDFVASAPGDNPEQLALVMEYVDGQNLHKQLREQLVPISQRLQWLAQIAQGLAVAHDAGIIHRDLKTENILINQRGEAKISDLGIAKSQDYSATLTDHVAGSYCSMSPEQAMGEAIDFKSDLFSLGILAYQLLCGAHPFGDTGNKLQIMQRIISHPPTPPGKHNPGLPAELVALLGQLLSKDPAKRPASSHWVAAQFEAFTRLNLAADSFSDETQALPGTAPARPTTSAEPSHPTFDTRFVAAPLGARPSIWQRLQRTLAAHALALGAGALGLVALGGLLLWQAQPPATRYVAVLPPTLVAEGMAEAQQALVKSAVYDALQQSVIRLQGYHLIPQQELAQLQGDLGDIQRATAADELISASLNCQTTTCSLELSRVSASGDAAQPRLNLAGRRQLDLLTDNLLSLSNLVFSNSNHLFNQKPLLPFNPLSEENYAALLQAGISYRHTGASAELLASLDGLDPGTKQLSALQTLYREICLDLYHQTAERQWLNRLQNLLDQYAPRQLDLAYWYNRYYLQVAQGDEAQLAHTQAQLTSLNASQAALLELSAFNMSQKNDYAAAIALHQQALSLRKTASSYFYLANAHWHLGNTAAAKHNIQLCLELFPDHYEARSLEGMILLTEGDSGAAARLLEQLSHTNPKDLHNLANLGLAYFLEHQFSQAAGIFARAVALAPNNAALLLNLADAHNLDGQTARAQQAYQQLIVQLSAANDAESLALLAQAYAHTGDYRNALASLRQLERMDGDRAETFYTASIINTLAGNNVAAIFNAEQTLKAGMSASWFSFAWFDRLCEQAGFVALLGQYQAPERCSGISNGEDSGKESAPNPVTGLGAGF